MSTHNNKMKHLMTWPKCIFSFDIMIENIFAQQFFSFVFDSKKFLHFAKNVFFGGVFALFHFGTILRNQTRDIFALS